MTDELCRLLAEATPGPWSMDLDVFAGENEPPEFEVCITNEGIDLLFRSETGVMNEVTQASSIAAMATQPAKDAAFIVAAINTLPAFLDVVDAARACNPVHVSPPHSDEYAWTEDVPDEVADGCTACALRAALARLDGAS